MQHGIDTLVLAGSCMQKWNVNEWIPGNAKLKYVSFRWCMVTVLGIFGCCMGVRTAKALVNKMSPCSHGSADWNMGCR